MKASNSQYDLRCVELSHTFFEIAPVLELFIEVTTSQKVHDKVNPFVILEDIVNIYNEWVRKLKQNLLFTYYIG